MAPDLERTPLLLERSFGAGRVARDTGASVQQVLQRRGAERASQRLADPGQARGVTTQSGRQVRSMARQRRKGAISGAKQNPEVAHRQFVNRARVKAGSIRRGGQTVVRAPKIRQKAGALPTGNQPPPLPR